MIVRIFDLDCHAGKNGTAIQMGNLPVNQGVLSKGSSEEAMAALKTRTRKRWRHLLEIHAQHSHPDASAPAAQPEGGIPRTRQHALRCSRSKELHSLCCEYLVATKDFLQKVSVLVCMERDFNGDHSPFCNPDKNLKLSLWENRLWLFCRRPVFSMGNC